MDNSSQFPWIADVKNDLLHNEYHGSAQHVSSPNHNFQIPIAAVIFHKEQNVVEEDLKTWINQRVDAKFQRVADVQVLEDFPRNIAGKTLKREMREIYVNNWFFTH